MNAKVIFIGLCLLIAVTMSKGQETFERKLLNDMMSKILLEEYENTPTADGYKLSYKTSDGQVREEQGIIMNPGTDNEELVVMGSFGYEDENVRTVTMYTADKNGYRPRVNLKNRKTNPKLLASLVG